MKHYKNEEKKKVSEKVCVCPSKQEDVGQQLQQVIINETWMGSTYINTLCTWIKVQVATSAMFPYV